MTPAKIELRKDRILLSGDWTAEGVRHLGAKPFSHIVLPTFPVEIEATHLDRLDTAGALLIYEFKESLASKNIKVKALHVNPRHEALMQIVTEKIKSFIAVARTKPLNPLQKLGKMVDQYLVVILSWLSFIGEVCLIFLHMIFVKPLSFKWKYFFNIVERTGYRALPIIAFLSALIGVVMAYQIGVELQNYGANIYIIQLLGAAVLKEFGPLITAIIVIGRTGSAYTAQLGTMKINQEIDALQTMGLSPVEMLIIPRIAGLIFVMPLLTVWSDFFGIAGGAFMSNIVLGVTYYNFIHQFPQEVDLSSFLIGIGKAPVFAALIASVGCFHGFKVSGSADSIGLETTNSVVMAIFLIIMADAFFSITLTWLGL